MKDRLYFIGVTYKQLGNFEKSLEYLYQSLYIFREDDNRLFQCYPINIIGSIYFENGDYTKALEYFEEGLEIRQTSLDKLGEAGSLDGIGFTHFKLGNYAQAITYCKRSLVIAKALSEDFKAMPCCTSLRFINKQEKLRRQQNFRKEASELKKAIGDRRRQTEMLLFLADLYKTVDLNKVLEVLNNALQIAEETKMVDLLSRAHFQLSGYYKQGVIIKMRKASGSSYKPREGI